VSNELRPTGDRDTLFPLQAALGYSIAQTLFIGKWTVIVEGITDFWILKALNACLAALGDDDTLNEEIVLIPAGGTSRLMPLASIMLASMSHADGRLIVLLDSDAPGKQAAERLEKTFANEAPVIMLGTAIGLTEATIEDLIPRPRYAAAVKKAEGRTFTFDAKENAAPTNVKCMELLFKRKSWDEFGLDQKATAALALIAEWGEDCANVPPETLEFARKLFREINRRFAPSKTTATK
jgi:predicted ATP-dependent endonuclease of OLD family